MSAHNQFLTHGFFRVIGGQAPHRQYSTTDHRCADIAIDHQPAARCSRWRSTATGSSITPRLIHPANGTTNRQRIIFFASRRHQISFSAPATAPPIMHGLAAHFLRKTAFTPRNEQVIYPYDRATLSRLIDARSGGGRERHRSMRGFFKEPAREESSVGFCSTNPAISNSDEHSARSAVAVRDEFDPHGGRRQRER